MYCTFVETILQEFRDGFSFYCLRFRRHSVLCLVPFYDSVPFVDIHYFPLKKHTFSTMNRCPEGIISNFHLLGNYWGNEKIIIKEIGKRALTNSSFDLSIFSSGKNLKKIKQPTKWLMNVYVLRNSSISCACLSLTHFLSHSFHFKSIRINKNNRNWKQLIDNVRAYNSLNFLENGEKITCMVHGI